MLTLRAFGLVLGGVVLSGCLSGQTGSPDCVGPTSCVCDMLYVGGALLRVHGESVGDGTLVAVVDEALGSVHEALDVRAGDRIGGLVTVEKPCDEADRSASLEGEELFVLFSPGTNGDYPRCGSQAEQVCTEQRADALLNGSFRFVVPWAEQLDFGGDHRLASSEVAALSSPEACWEHFPLGPTPPCNDSTAVCSVSRPAPTSNGLPWLGAVLGLSLVGVARRRSLRRS